MFNLPFELQDKIISFTDFETAVRHKNAFQINKLCAPEIHIPKLIEENNLEILKLIKDGFTKNHFDTAARDGRLEVVKWLHNNRTEGCTRMAMDHAAGNGHLTIVKFLHENRTEGCTDNVIELAALNGYYEIVKYLYDNKLYTCLVGATDRALVNGHTEIYNFLKHQ